MAIEAGKLRHKFGLYSLTDTREASGQKVKTPVFVRNLQCEIVDANQVIRRLGVGVDFSNKLMLHCRFNSAVAMGMQVMKNNINYKITAIENPELRNVELYITVEKVV
jgi:head-tail adaptor